MTPPPVRSFGPFDLDSPSGELRKHGLRVRLAGHPLVLRQLFLEHPWALVPRDAIRQWLWRAGTFVDFDTGLTSVVRKLRDAPGDAAERPRFVETLPRRRYRFAAPDTVPAPPAVCRTMALPRNERRYRSVLGNMGSLP